MACMRVMPSLSHCSRCRGHHPLTPVTLTGFIAMLMLCLTQPTPASAQALPLAGAVIISWPYPISGAPVPDKGGESDQTKVPGSDTYDQNGFDPRGYGSSGTDLFPYPVPDFVHSYHGWSGIKVDGIHYGIGDDIPPFDVRLERIGYRTLAFTFKGVTYIRPLFRD